MIVIIGIIFIILLIILLKNNKKVLFTILGSLVVIVMVYYVVIYINHKTTKTYTLEEITGVRFEDIYKVSIDYSPNKDVKKDFINEYGKAVFRKEKYIDEIIKEKIFKNNFAGTAKIYSYICYDDNDNIKYTFSPRGGKLYLCKVKIDKEEIEIYQINERKK